jgi:EAL domain-containing protein (putative c-di-GMP-specific phosphodiesterase class I)
MSVNVSLAQLESESLVSDVADALSTSGLDPHALVIEVAEMALLRNTALALQRLTALKALGVRIAVDDFGTGFSSLAYLRQFPIDILKIDRSFIDSVATSSESSTLIHTLVEFGQTLGLEVIAEGIENEGQLHPLILANCDAGQGFLYGRPLTPAQLDLFLSMHDTAGSSLWVVRPE